MKIITVQPSMLPDLKLLYPYDVDESGIVQRQNLWRGDPIQILGFVGDLDRQEIDLPWSQVVADPEVAVGMYMISLDKRGAIGTHDVAIETMTVTEKD